MINAAARRRMIGELKTEDPVLYQAFLEDRRQAEGDSQFVRNGGRYPLCGRGDINTYAIFAETNCLILGPTGRVGCIVPSGIATDDTTKFFFQNLMQSRSLVSLLDFENREGFFPTVDSRMKFCLLTLIGSAQPVKHGAEFVFFAHTTDVLREKGRSFTLTAEDLALLNPNTRTCPIFRSKYDAELTKAIYRKVPPLIGQTGPDDWQVKFFKKMIDFSSHAKLISFAEDPPGPEWVGVYEAKMLSLFNHRLTTYLGVSETDRNVGNARSLEPGELNDPFFFIKLRCWVTQETFRDRMNGRPWSHRWFVSMRDVTNTTNERTAIFAIRPAGPAVDKLPSLFLTGIGCEIACFVASLSSFVFDYVARQKVGGTNMGGYILEQLPVLPRPWLESDLLRVGASHAAWIGERAIELIYTAWDLEPFGRDCGYNGPPFRWDEQRRFLLRCELDAAYFHLYGIARDDVDYIMQTFPIVKRKDEQKYGEYRTKRMILEIYDAMAEAIHAGKPYQTLLDPPPADPRVAHPPRQAAAG